MTSPSSTRARAGRRLSIGAKLYGAFGAAIGLLLAVGILSIHSLGRVNDEGRTMYAKGTEGIRQLGLIDAGLADGQRLMLRGLIEVDQRAAQREVDAEIAAVTRTTDKAIEAETAIDQSPKEEALVTRFQAELSSYRQALAEVRRLSRAGDRAAALTAYGTAVTRYDAADDVLQQLVELNAEEAHQLDEQISSTYSSSKLLV